MEFRTVLIDKEPAKTNKVLMSCSFCNNINFAWRLIMCPQEVIDYIVVHELCHIKNKSHNRAFWESVADVMPDYKKQEKWLKTNRRLMRIL